MLDIKVTSDEDHIKITGRSNKTILKNALYLASLGKLYEIRTVVIEGIGNEKTVDDITKILSPYLSNQNIRYKIIKYRSIGVRSEFSSYIAPDDKKIEKLKELAMGNGFYDVLIE